VAGNRRFGQHNQLVFQSCRFSWSAVPRQHNGGDLLMAVGIYVENDDGVVVLDDSRNVLSLLAKNSSPSGTLFTAQGEGATYAFGLPQAESNWGVKTWSGDGDLLFDAIAYGRMARPVGAMSGNILNTAEATVTRQFPAGRTYAAWITSPVSSLLVRNGSISVGGSLNYVYYLDMQEMDVRVSGGSVSITARRFESGNPMAPSPVPYDSAGTALWRALVLDVTNF